MHIIISRIFNQTIIFILTKFTMGPLCRYLNFFSRAVGYAYVVRYADIRFSKNGCGFVFLMIGLYP